MALLHGVSTSHNLEEISALLDAGLPERDIPLALLAFNIGVEVGQLVFIGTIVALALLFSRWRLPAAATVGARPVLAYAIGTLSAFWFIDRRAGFSS